MGASDMNDRAFSDGGRRSPLYRVAPGLQRLLQYRFREDFWHDLVAGVCVAAVALPVAIAYAELAGLRPEVGLYSCILPLVAYAVFGTSRQLIVNPDATACAMVAASVAPLAAGDPELYASFSVALAFFAGVLCILAGFFRLGALADFLSKPILVGYLNGVGVSIFLGQVGKVCGFSVEAGGIVPRIVEIFSKLAQVHWATLAVGAGALVGMLFFKRFLPRAPAALIAMIGAGAAVAFWKLDARGVAVLGEVAGGVPAFLWPDLPVDKLPALAAKAAGLALVLFSSGMLTARSFATKNGYEVDADKELAAFGAANIASAVSQGFAVTGADSRTAMSDASGGRTQVTGLVAAVSIAVVLLFFTSPLKYVPTPALGAVLIVGAFSLLNIGGVREIFRIDKGEGVLCVVTTLGVVAVGAIDAILVAVALALARFVQQAARPKDEILGKVEGMPGFHSVARHAGAKTFPGLVMYRFGGPIAFFNAAYFKQRALSVADAAGAGLRWFVIDAIPITHIDVTGLDAVRELRRRLQERGVEMVLAGRRTEYLNWLEQIGERRLEHDQLAFPTMRQAFRAFQEMQKGTVPVCDPRMEN